MHVPKARKDTGKQQNNNKQQLVMSPTFHCTATRMKEAKKAVKEGQKEERKEFSNPTVFNKLCSHFGSNFLSLNSGSLAFVARASTCKAHIVGCTARRGEATTAVGFLRRLVSISFELMRK